MEELGTVIELLSRSVKRSPLLVLTGAGCSTESGIPDYRSPNGLYSKGHRPITIQQFRSSEKARKRYWARSLFGYASLSGRRPNLAHGSLAHLLVQRNDLLHALVTQNVDGLHLHAAHAVLSGTDGSFNPEWLCTPVSSLDLVELHGNIHLVRCMNCGDVTRRNQLQDRLVGANQLLVKEHAFMLHPTLHTVATDAQLRPDGDFEVPLDLEERMTLVACDACGGILQPHVVLFGDNVLHSIVEKVHGFVAASGAVLCIGTSLQVFSAFRFVRRAALDIEIPVMILNDGPTRADELPGVTRCNVKAGCLAAAVSQVVDGLQDLH